MSVATVGGRLRPELRASVVWGVVVGAAQAATPLAFWWLDAATVYALGLLGIAFIYIGFAVADGRRRVLAVESGVTGMFVIVAAAAITSTPWLFVVGLAGHGVKDLWQHRTQFVAKHSLVAPVLSRGRLWRLRRSLLWRSSPVFSSTTETGQESPPGVASGTVVIFGCFVSVPCSERRDRGTAMASWRELMRILR